MKRMIFYFLILGAMALVRAQNHRIYLNYTYQSGDLDMTGFYPSVEYLYTGFKYKVGLSWQYFKNYYTVYDVVNPYTGIRHVRRHEYFRMAWKPRVLFPLIGNKRVEFSMMIGPYFEYLRTVIYNYSGYHIDPTTHEFVDHPGYPIPHIGFFLGVYAGFRLDFTVKKWAGKIFIEYDGDLPNMPVLIMGIGVGRSF